MEQENNVKDQTVIWMTDWTYPLTGIEDFFHQSTKWMKSTVFWISFKDNQNKNYTNYQCQKFDNYYSITHPGGPCLNNELLIYTLKVLKPAFVHYSGIHSIHCLKLCQQLEIPIVIGYHYWTGLISSMNGSFDRILEHQSNYQQDESFKLILKEADRVYSVSDYMNSVIETFYGARIYTIYPTPPLLDILPADRKYISLINLSYGKGGELFEQIIQQLPELPFCGVSCEPYSELDDKIKSKVVCHFSRSDNQLNTVYATTKILLIPSIIDETFSRIAVESLYYRIPVITTGAGNIRNILGSAAIYCEYNNISSWLMSIQQLYRNPDFYAAQMNLIESQRSLIIQKYNSQTTFLEMVADF